MKTNSLVAFLLVSLLISYSAVAQKFYTKNAKIRFFSKAPLENIEAINSQAICVLDASTMDIQFSMLMRSFEFEKALMQEHFNENYVESNKYPKATFKGQLLSPKNLPPSGNKVAAKVKGEMTLHGVTRSVEADGFITVSDDKVKIESVFQLMPEDYGIKIEKMYIDKIAKTLEIKVLADLQKKE